MVGIVIRNHNSKLGDMLVSNNVYGIIYKVTNNINNKVYIGKTTKTLEQRIKQHIKDFNRKSRPLSVDIKKYGVENFSYEIISEVYKEELLTPYEGLFIELYESYKEDKGYNSIRYVDGKYIYPDFMFGNVRGSKFKNTKSKYLGVYIRDGFYASSIYIKGKNISIGCFSEEIDAAKARDIKELEYIGDEAVLNFMYLKDDYISKKIKVKRAVHSKNNDSNIKNVYITPLRTWTISIKNKHINYRKTFKTQQEAEQKAIEIHKQIGTKNYYKNTDPYIVFTGFKTKEE
jgi:hypothetical protein